MQARPKLALRVAWDLIRIRLIHGGIGRIDSDRSRRTPDE
jgi:hypothetical protein